MTASGTGILTVVAAMTIESFAQMCLKVGASGGPKILVEPYQSQSISFAILSYAKSWIVIGILLYLIEIGLWTLALHQLDVSIAFPMGSLCFVGVALLSQLFLGESVGRLRWIGVFCILAGTVFITL